MIYKPFEDNKKNYLEMLNEVTLIFSGYFLLYFNNVDNIEDAGSELMGYCLCGLTILMFLAHSLVMIV